MKKQSPKIKRVNTKDFPTLNIVSELDIATDFATKAYQKFDKLIKSVILFGSTVKKTNVSGSDIDIIIIIDDASVKFDTELTAWYREELGKIIASNPYKKELHINTVKLTTWWNDLLRGDPVVINIIRYGEEIIDFGGFFRPLRILLQNGRIKSTPEAIYTSLERAPLHLAQSKRAEISAVEGIYWAMVDSAHALLIASNMTPPSPEFIPSMLIENFVKNKKLEQAYVDWYVQVFQLYKGVVHGNIKEVKGQNIDDLQDKAEKFLSKMAEIIGQII